VKRLQDAFPSARFVFRNAGSPVSDAGAPVLDSGSPDFFLAVCGCPVGCAAREDEPGSRGRFAVTSQNDFASVCDLLRVNAGID
jgi:hypothetical protein